MGPARLLHVCCLSDFRGLARACKVKTDQAMYQRLSDTVPCSGTSQLATASLATF